MVWTCLRPWSQQLMIQVPRCAQNDFGTTRDRDAVVRRHLNSEIQVIDPHLPFPPRPTGKTLMKSTDAEDKLSPIKALLQTIPSDYFQREACLKLPTESLLNI